MIGQQSDLDGRHTPSEKTAKSGDQQTTSTKVIVQPSKFSATEENTSKDGSKLRKKAKV